jgi:hypothetical protein
MRQRMTLPVTKAIRRQLQQPVTPVMTKPAPNITACAAHAATTP